MNSIKIDCLPDGTLVPFEGNISGIKVRVIIEKCHYGSKNIEIETYVPQIFCRNDNDTHVWINASKGVIYKMTQIGNDKESISVDQLNNAINVLNHKVNQILECKKFLQANMSLKWAVFDSNLYLTKHHV